MYRYVYNTFVHLCWYICTKTIGYTNHWLYKPVAPIWLSGLYRLCSVLKHLRANDRSIDNMAFQTSLSPGNQQALNYGSYDLFSLRQYEALQFQCLPAAPASRSMVILPAWTPERYGLLVEHFVLGAYVHKQHTLMC